MSKPLRKVPSLGEGWQNPRPGNAAYPFRPTDQQRAKVRAMAAVGVPQDQIALAVRIDAKTLRKHFREELDTAAAEANAQVAGRLFKLAMEGNPIACIYWTKARMGWVDRKEVNHTHNIGPMMTHEERLAMLEQDPDEPPVIDGEATEEDDETPGSDGGA
jgi:hypothetical protein